MQYHAPSGKFVVEADALQNAAYLLNEFEARCFGV